MRTDQCWRHSLHHEFSSREFIMVDGVYHPKNPGQYDTVQDT